jgi:hypothetical protein
MGSGWARGADEKRSEPDNNSARFIVVSHVRRTNYRYDCGSMLDRAQRGRCEARHIPAKMGVSSPPRDTAGQN